jgi:hypothetical protein
MFRKTGRVGNCTNWECSRFVKHIERAFVARRYSGENDACLTFESCNSTRFSGVEYRGQEKMFTFGTTIDQRLQAFGIFGIYEINESRVHPAPSFNGIETTYDKIELHVVIIVFVLDFAKVPEIIVSKGSGSKVRTDGVTLTPGTRFITNSAATVALGCPTSFGLGTSIENRKTLNDYGPKEELSVQITDIDRVHVNNMDVFESQ